MDPVQETSETLGVAPFDTALEGGDLYPLTSTGVTTLQVNMGRLCNMACRHCHVEAGPGRTEVMGAEVLRLCLEALKKGRYPVVDITGGAPETNPGYRWFVRNAAADGHRVITRTNLTILLEEGFEDLPAFFAKFGVEVVASLPHYSGPTTDRLRGEGAFKTSIEALKRLNGVGYGRAEGLRLSLVYNPCGAFLPPPEASLEADFKRELMDRHGVSFTELYTITNMPVGRFLRFLKDSGNLRRYMERLRSSYNPLAAANAMCRQTLSVGWDGSLYDCDFNQMLGLKCGFGAPDHIRDFDPEALDSRRVVTGPHCYGCTAGAGSSCTGEVTKSRGGVADSTAKAGV